MTLDRKPRDGRTFRAINTPAGVPRREEMLLAPEVMRQVILLRKMLSAVGQIEGTELLLQRLGKTKTNKEFLPAIAKSMEEKKTSKQVKDKRPHVRKTAFLLWIFSFLS